MKKLLNDINAVTGVTGSFVCDEEGRILVSALPALFDDAILSTVGRAIAQTMAGLMTERRRKTCDVDLIYDEGRFITKSIRVGCLCILCVRNINLPLLSLAINTAAKKLQTMIVPADS